MKPLHASFKRLTRCPCCLGRYAKVRGGSKAGKSAARQRAKEQIKKEVP